jgi:hypothetical protein
MPNQDQKLGIRVKEFHRTMRSSSFESDDEFNSLLYWIYHNPWITSVADVEHLLDTMKAVEEQQRVLNVQKQAFVQQVQAQMRAVTKEASSAQ